jgi:multiple sugar transport system ATP-binding protein
MATVELRSVGKHFGAVSVLREVSLSIADGEFLTLVGPSGCGKSTLLRMIAGLETISSGDIAIGGRVVNDLPPRARDIAMVFQSYALYPHKTVAGNMGYALKLAGVPKAEIQRRVAEAAEMLALTPLLGRLPRQLSGGQRQRVAMGRAIVRDPAVFLFDEPLSNLDAKLRVHMRAEIKELHHRLKTTTVYVTHDQVEAMTMADRIAVLNGGIVEQEGSPLDLYDRPANTFVAGFLGSPAMNLFTGMLREDAAGVRFILTDGPAIPLRERPAPAADGRPLLLGLRPEHLARVGDDDPAGFDVRVAVDEPTGAETLVSARLGSQAVMILFRERVRVPTGATIRLAAQRGHAHLFDPDTGRRLA